MNMMDDEVGCGIVSAAVILVILVVALVFGFGIFFNGGCNRQIVDMKYHFTEAMLKMPDGTCKTIKIKSWCDYENSDQIQVIDKEGTVYLGHACNIMLIQKED